MRLDESCERVFARHETFHPRYGWIKKALDAALQEEDVFNREDAVVQMGVGKNMVKAIRHWGLAFKVIQPVTGHGRRPRLEPTSMGMAWFSDQYGVDPYMELPGTDWLMHWFLLAPSSQAPVWWIGLNDFSAIEFSEEQLLQFVLDRLSTFSEAHVSSVKKDVSVFLRMYASGHGARATFEDRIDAPFRELGLLQPSIHEAGHYRFHVGAKPTLPAKVFAATVLDFAARTDPDARTVSLSRALAEPGSPGRAFKLTDDAALRASARSVERLPSRIALTSSAGMPQLTMKESSSRWQHVAC